MASHSTSSDAQTWLFLREQMSGTPEDFYIGHIDIDKLKSRGLTLKNCLSLANIEGGVDTYSFHIFIASMRTSVRLLSDESLKFHYDSFCTKDPFVQTIIRPAGDPGPSSFKCPSWENLFQRIMEISHGELVPVKTSKEYLQGWIAAKATSPLSACPKDCPGRMKKPAVNTDSHTR